jgi:DNA-binding CsgD family transcriptional regulator
MLIKDPKRIQFEQELLARLSRRERQILQLFLEGMTQKQMCYAIVERDAEESLLSTKTINTYKMSVREKLGCANDVEMVKLAVRNQLIDVWSKSVDLQLKVGKTQPGMYVPTASDRLQDGMGR